MCRLWNLGASTSWNPQGLSRPVMGLLYHFNNKLVTFHCITSVHFRHPVRMSRTCFGRYLEPFRQSLRVTGGRWWHVQLRTQLAYEDFLICCIVRNLHQHMYSAGGKKVVRQSFTESWWKKISRESPGRDAAVSSFPTWSAAYLKQTLTSDLFLIFFIVVPCILITSRFFSPRNALVY